MTHEIAVGHPSALGFVTKGLASAILPPEKISFDEWLPRNIVLVDGPLKGSPWRAEGAPYLKAIAACLSEDHPARHVVVRKCQQSGVSILAMSWAIYLAEQVPDNVLYGVPGSDSLREMNGRKLQPLIDAYEKRRGRPLFRPTTLRSGAGSTTYEKRFPGGYMALANANAAMDLSGHTARWGIEDELSKWEHIPGYGDPEELFYGRFTAFRDVGEYKILSLSTPEVDSGDDDGLKDTHCRIDRKFRQTDQCYWHIECPNCHDGFVQSFDRFEVDRDDPDASVMICSECGCPMNDAQRRRANRHGEFVGTAEALPGHVGFHVDAFITTMMNYGEIARDWLKAEPKGEIAKKAFWNLVLGLPYAMRGDAPDHVRLMERKEAYDEGVIPAEGLILVCGADVQHNGIWAEIIAYGEDRQSWCVMHRFLEGNTDVPEAGAWLALEKLRAAEYSDVWGRARTIDAMAVDAGDGGRANQVYAFTRGRPNTYAIHGVAGWDKPSIGTPKKVDINLAGQKVAGGAHLWPVGTWSLKSEFYQELRKRPGGEGEPPFPPGYCHFGQAQDEGYFRQITAEYLSTTVRNGRRVDKWMESGANHLLDCRIYGKAMADYLGLSRMLAPEWAKLRASRGAPAGQEPTLFSSEPERVAASAPPARKPKTPRRRILSRGIDV